MKYELVLFDLDGTMIDSAESIIYCCQKSLDHYGYRYQKDTDFSPMLGGHLAQNFMDFFHVDPNEIRDVVKLYRDFYAKEGILKAKPYGDIEYLLKELRNQGAKIGIATMKREDFAVRMMGDFQLVQYFDCIYGMDADDSKTKSDIIRQCQVACSTENEVTVMIGDTIGDKQAAEECGIDFITVTYGYGFSKNTTKEHNFVANQPKEILKYLI